MSLYDDFFESLNETISKNTGSVKSPIQVQGVGRKKEEVSQAENIKSTLERLDDLREKLKTSDFHVLLFAVGNGESSEMQISCATNNEKMIKTLYAAFKSSKEIRECAKRALNALELNSEVDISNS